MFDISNTSVKLYIEYQQLNKFVSFIVELKRTVCEFGFVNNWILVIDGFIVSVMNVKLVDENLAWFVVSFAQTFHLYKPSDETLNVEKFFCPDVIPVFVSFNEKEPFVSW